MPRIPVRTLIWWDGQRSPRNVLWLLPDLASGFRCHGKAASCSVGGPQVNPGFVSAAAPSSGRYPRSILVRGCVGRRVDRNGAIRRANAHKVPSSCRPAPTFPLLIEPLYPTGNSDVVRCGNRLNHRRATRSQAKEWKWRQPCHLIIRNAA